MFLKPRPVIDKGSHFIRKYADNNDNTIVYINYEQPAPDEVLVTLLHSKNRGKGVARLAFTRFIHENKGKTIYVKLTDELGADMNMLVDFYTKLGFKHYKDNIYVRKT